MAYAPEQSTDQSGAAPTASPSRRASTWGLAALCLLTLSGLVVLFEARDPARFVARITQGQAAVHLAVGRLGIWGPVGFTALCAGLMLICIPVTPVILIAGFLFGPVFGALSSLLGSTVAAIGVFELSRAGLAPRLTLGKGLLRRIETGFRRDAMLYMIALRIMPIVPFGPIHVVAALFDVPQRTFVIGTVIGMIPIVAIYAYLGNDLSGVAASGRRVDLATFLNPQVFWPLAGLALLMLAPVVVRTIQQRRT